jgi:hypothetical protein
MVDSDPRIEPFQRHYPVLIIQVKVDCGTDHFVDLVI